MPPPQAFISTYAPRLRCYGNSLLTPIIQPTVAQNLPTSRTTKRGTTAINYADDLYDDDDFDEVDGPRRPTGLRSLRREDPNQPRETAVDKLGRELSGPVDVQGIWREWMGKPKFGKTDTQLHVQTTLPLTFIPIRIDLDIPAFTPHPALPLPADAASFGINPSLPAYKTPDAIPPYRLKDFFLWNLHESLITPDQFALILVRDLDLPNAAGLAIQISNQIRTQLEEYAGVALHPLFHCSTKSSGNGMADRSLQVLGFRDEPTTPVLTVPAPALMNGASIALQGGGATFLQERNMVTATASPLPAPVSIVSNPDDTYRCIIVLNINLLNKIYTDRFEWSLLHPPGVAEQFAKQTCADIGLAGEWIPAVTHAIYEAVLRLKKEACESGGLVGGNGFGGDFDNLAFEGYEAGWRFDNEHLADGWEPKVEILSKEEIEKREGDRERQIRRLRRETARFSSTTNMASGIPTQASYFDLPESTDTPMGRGERSKKKRRFRSLSPLARGGTPGGRGTPDTGNVGYGGGGGLSEWERQTWRCSHCLVHGAAVWAVRDGPSGSRSLCNNCGLVFEREKQLPPWSKDLHRHDVPVGGR